MPSKRLTHALTRTSPKGGPFYGRCTQCGMEGLDMTGALRPCYGSRGQMKSQPVPDESDGAMIKAEEPRTK